MNILALFCVFFLKGEISFDISVLNNTCDSLTISAIVVNQSENVIQVPRYFGPAGWGLEMLTPDSEVIKDNGLRTNPWWKGGFVEVIPGGIYGRVISLSKYYHVNGDSLKAVFRLKKTSDPSNPGFVGIDVSSDTISIRLRKNKIEKSYRD